MDLKKLVDKLKEIPFENWKREKQTLWIKYETQINEHKIQLEILPPQKPTDCTQYRLNTYSPKDELILYNLENSEISNIGYNLEKKYIQKQEEDNCKKAEKTKKSLAEFLKNL